MNWQVLTPVVSAILSAISIVLVAYLTKRSEANTAKEVSQSSPYQALADRVTLLEREVAQAMKDQRVDRQFILQLLVYYPKTAPMPSPQPHWLMETIGTLS